MLFKKEALKKLVKLGKEKTKVYTKLCEDEGESEVEEFSLQSHKPKLKPELPTTSICSEEELKQVSILKLVSTTL